MSEPEKDLPDSCAIPREVAEDFTPLPTRIPLAQRPPPPPFFEGKPLALKHAGELPLKTLAKLRLLRIDDLPIPEPEWFFATVPAVQVAAQTNQTPSDPQKTESVVATSAAARAATSDQGLPAVDETDLEQGEGRFVWHKLLPPTGSLADCPAAQIVGWAVSTGFTGCLWCLEQEQTQARELFFEAGALLGVRSFVAQERVSELMGPLWTPAQKKRAQVVLRNASGVGFRKQLDLLSASKLIDAKEFCQRQVDCVLEVLCRTLRIQAGSYRFLEHELPSSERLLQPLSPRFALVWAVRKALPLPVLQRAIGGFQTRLFPKTQGVLPAGGFALVNLGLSPREEEALQLFDGDRSLQEIAEITGLGEHALFALCYTLLALGTVTHPHNLDATDKRRLLASRKARAQAKAHQEALSAIQKKARLCESGDYFAVLEVGKDATLAEIRAAYERVRAAAAPSRRLMGLEKELNAIATVLDEAAAVLGDPVRRACYRPR